MVETSPSPDAIAVLDIGRTNVKLVAVSPQGRVLSSRQAPNAIRSGDPYPHYDVPHIERWLMAALADLGERFAIQAIVPTTHGSSAALIDDDGLVLPVMDYESDRPTEVAAAYTQIAPWFEECLCPIDPAGLTLGRQLFWQSRACPDEFARARHILPFPQYWAWRLSGVPTCEVTSLGAQTQLWNPRAGTFSSLVRREGWTDRFPPLRKAWTILGPLKPDVALRACLPADTPVLCGIHDGNANFARYLAGGLGGFTLVSTGTWTTAFNPSLPVEGLDPLQGSVASTDLEGRPVASARFMGGREHALVAGSDGAREAPDLVDIAALIERGAMALPSFTDSGGPYPGTGGKGRIAGRATAPRARAALASLYLALMMDVELDLLRSTGPVILDGGFADHPLFVSLLAALRADQPLLVSHERAGTAIGAALLWGWPARREPVPLDLGQVEAPAVPGLADYALRWRAAADGVSRASPATGAG